jgi:hypothetical protein
MLMDGKLWLAALALAAAAIAPREAAAQDRVDCAAPAPGEYFIFVENAPVRPGASLEVSVKSMAGPFGVITVEPSCVRSWRVTPRDHARLSRDRTRLLIDDDAPAGTVVGMEARVAGRTLRDTVTVIDPSQLSVRGSWVRSCGADGDEAAIEQIVLHPDAYFLIDFLGRQWSGSYTFDPATGAIAFGPQVLPVPEGSRMEGTATVGEDGRLTLDGVFFADPYLRPAGADCPMVFSRRP